MIDDIKRIEIEFLPNGDYDVSYYFYHSGDEAFGKSEYRSGTKTATVMDAFEKVVKEFINNNTGD